MNQIIRFLRSEEAATTVEYAVLIALILAAVITTIDQVGTKTNDAFVDLDTQMP